MVFQANFQNPVLAYLPRHEIPAAMRNLDNHFVTCHYPGANAFTEEYHQRVHGSGPFYKVPDEARFLNRLRDMLAPEEGDALWLASRTPRRWRRERRSRAPDGQVLWAAQLHHGGRAGPGNSERSVAVAQPLQGGVAGGAGAGRTAAPKRRDRRQAWKDCDGAGGWVHLLQKPGPMRVIVRY